MLYFIFYYSFSNVVDILYLLVKAKKLLEYNHMTIGFAHELQKCKPYWFQWCDLCGM